MLSTQLHGVLCADWMWDCAIHAHHAFSCGLKVTVGLVVCVPRHSTLLCPMQGLNEVVYVSGHTLQVASVLGKVVPYRFDAVLDQTSTQVDVFSQVRPLVDAAVSGYNATVFAYGQTGTGKTHTMLGVDMWQLASGSSGASSLAAVVGRVPKDSLGIIPRCMEYLFSALDARREDVTRRVWCSYVEIYNEKVFDLLSSRPQDRTRDGGLDIRQDKNKGVFLQDVVEVAVDTVEDVLSVLWQGARNRAISATDMNDHSSRSHTIFSVSVEQTVVSSGEASGDVTDVKLIKRSKVAAACA